MKIAMEAENHYKKLKSLQKETKFRKKFKKSAK